jgi:hypothetical protein
VRDAEGQGERAPDPPFWTALRHELFGVDRAHNGVICPLCRDDVARLSAGTVSLFILILALGHGLITADSGSPDSNGPPTIHGMFNTAAEVATRLAEPVRLKTRNGVAILASKTADEIRGRE